MPNFDDAIKATEEMFENEAQLSLEDAPTEETAEEVPAEEEKQETTEE